MFSVVLKGNLQIPHVDYNTEYARHIYQKLQRLGTFSELLTGQLSHDRIELCSSVHRTTSRGLVITDRYGVSKSLSH